VTADKGLCGSFNTNIIKSAGSFIVDNPKPARSDWSGERPGLRRRGFRHVRADRYFSTPALRRRADHQSDAVDAFIAGTVDRWC
jgi:hypothetical protein